MSDFTLSIKSTIDKLGSDLATSQGTVLIDLDDLVVAGELFKTKKSAIVWEFLTLDEYPSDPLYTFSFRMGARTVNDTANYNVLAMVDKVKGIFPTREKIDISNYAGAVAGPIVGNMYITDVGVDPQQYDKEFGMRMMIVSGRAVRNG